MVTKIATGECEETQTSGKRNGGLAGSVAKNVALSAAKRKEVTKVATKARWS